MSANTRVLVVDDSKTMRMMLTKYLVGMGFDVTQAEDGVHALEVFDAALDRDGAFPVVLTDWSMPNMDGLTLVKALRRRRAAADTVVVMVSSENDQSHIARALLAGVDEYVMKPVTSDGLAATLEMLGVKAS